MASPTVVSPHSNIVLFVIDGDKMVTCWPEIFSTAIRGVRWAEQSRAGLLLISGGES